MKKCSPDKCFADYALFLDDERKPENVSWVKLPEENWCIARSFDQFVDMIFRIGIPRVVTFDHDLADNHYPTGMQRPGDVIDYDSYEEKTGYHAAKFLVALCRELKRDLPEYYIHTMNIIGKQNIANVFEDYKRERQNGQTDKNTTSA